ncbi:DUF6056 family protein [Streptomyces niveus]|uniref:DUF6056 family protein n=1 Tax=Streptomyces niveus TaxID=193462 RepID=UPI003627123B
MERVPEKSVQPRHSEDVRTTRARGWTPLWIGLLTLPPVALLAAAAWFGRLVRPGGDDWCFLPQVGDGGLFAIVEKFYFVDNGRVANAVLVWSYARFGVAGQQWFGLFSGVLVLALLWAFIATAGPRAGMRVPRGVPFLVASIVTVLFLLGSPNTYKTFYWPAASVSHTLPPVLACAAVIPVLRATSQRGRVLALLTVFVAGLILGTLSEETSVVAVVVLASALLISGRLFPEARRRFLRLCCAAGITGTVIGTLILFTSPGAQHRRERHYTVSALAPETLLASLRGFAHIVITCLTTWQYLGAVAAGVLLALLARAPRSGLTPMKNQMLCAGAGAGALLVSGYLCTVITYPAFGPTVATSTRLWNDYLLLYILFLVFLGTLLARAWRHRMRWTGPAMAAGAGVFALVCLSLAVSLTSLETDMAVRAGKWDRQDSRLRGGAAAGTRVLPYERMPLREMTEPFGAGGRIAWPAVCVADYYGLDSVTQAARRP